jgi:Mn2+/Fe2+ NRAMP family transporter
MKGPVVEARPEVDPIARAAARRGPLGKIVIGLSAVGPGLFLIGYNIGTGSITTMGMAGAQYGMTLLWALLLSGIFTYVLMVAFGHLTLVTGQTALNTFKTAIPKVGTYLALYVMVALILGELVALVGVMGIVSELIQEGIRLGSADQTLYIRTGWIILVVSTLIFLMLWYGRYKLFEKVLTTFVLLMVFSFVAVFFMVSPSYSAILAGMVPGIPNTPGASRLVAAMAGTTCSAAVFIVRSTVIAEKGWNITHLGHEKRDAFVSAFLMVFLSAVVMAVAAGTLHVMGVTMESTLEMIGLLEPIGGELAAFLLIVGISGAGLSTVFPLVLIAPWLVADYMGWERNLRAPVFRILIGVGLLFSFGSVFLEQTPPVLMVVAMALQAAILPAVAIPVLYLLNKRELMGEKYLPSRAWNAALLAVIVFSLVTTWFAITGLINTA